MWKLGDHDGLQSVDDITAKLTTASHVDQPVRSVPFMFSLDIIYVTNVLQEVDELARLMDSLATQPRAHISSQ